MIIGSLIFPRIVVKYSHNSLWSTISDTTIPKLTH